MLRKMMSSLEDLLRQSLDRLLGGEPMPKLRVLEGGNPSLTALIRLRIRIRNAKERIAFAQRWQRARVKAVHETEETPWGRLPNSLKPLPEYKSRPSQPDGLASTSTEPSPKE